jgi:transcriptional regulator with XRE-family HTH domain
MTEKQIQKVVGENVRGFREILEISQEQLAELCDVHRTYIGRLERGERAITTTTLIKIAKGLGLEHEYFLLLLTRSYQSFRQGKEIQVGKIRLSFTADYHKTLPKWIR